ncbi:MAG: hypothetical protein ABF868_01155 [Sporolactobacillus sp.]
MKTIGVCLLLVAVTFSFGFFLLGIMRIESLLLSGGVLFISLLLLVRLLTWRPQQTE